jgi:hypothetical protein
MVKRTKTVVVAGVAALAVAGIGGGVAFAANSGSGSAPVVLAAASTPAPSTSAPLAKAKKHHRLLARAEHAEATLRTKTGTEVVDYQRGTVTASSPTSITVRSKDGFTATYVVNSGTKVTKAKQKSAIADVATNDNVIVVAVKSGDTGTARRIADPTKTK